jgi:antitoxin CcdA
MEPIMLNFENAAKKATNLSLNVKVLEAAREMGMNLSQTVDSLLAEEVKKRYWAKWNEDNKEAMAAYNDRVAKHGLPLAKYRTWGKSLGDGHEGGDNGAL